MDREKVVKGLEGCISDMQEEIDEWRDYSDSELANGLTCDCEWWYNTAQTLKDALALLKAQEPRVLMPEEVRGSLKQPIWKETRSSHKGLYTGWVLAYDIQTGQGITGTLLGQTPDR